MRERYGRTAQNGRACDKHLICRDTAKSWGYALLSPASERNKFASLTGRVDIDGVNPSVELDLAALKHRSNGRRKGNAAVIQIVAVIQSAICKL
jgi:hypothetical protein